MLRAVAHGVQVAVVARSPFEEEVQAVVGFGHHAVLLGQHQSLFDEAALVLSVVDHVPGILIAQAVVGRCRGVAVEQAVHLVGEHIADAGSLCAGAS